MSSITTVIARNDILCFYALNRKLHSKAMSILMENMTHLGSTTFAVVTSLFSLIFNNRLGTMLAINLLASQAVIHILKRVVNRPRPYKTLEWVIAIKPPKCKYSLPSGHSSSALSIALVLSHFYPGLTMVFVTAALITGVSRIYLGCHYPTDVSVGLFISYATFITTLLF